MSVDFTDYKIHVKRCGQRIRTFQEDAFQAHRHEVLDDLGRAISNTDGGGTQWQVNASGSNTAADQFKSRGYTIDGAYTSEAPRPATETRPYSYGIQYYIKY